MMLTLNSKVFVHRFRHFLKEIIVWFITTARGGYLFDRDSLSVHRYDYLHRKKWICMNILPGVCFEPRTIQYFFEMIRISLRSGSNTQSLRRRFAVSDWLSSSIFWYVYASEVVPIILYSFCKIWVHLPLMTGILTPAKCYASWIKINLKLFSFIWNYLC